MGRNIHKATTLEEKIAQAKGYILESPDRKYFSITDEGHKILNQKDKLNARDKQIKNTLNYWKKNGYNGAKFTGNRQPEVVRVTPVEVSKEAEQNFKDASRVTTKRAHATKDTYLSDKDALIQWRNKKLMETNNMIAKLSKIENPTPKTIARAKALQKSAERGSVIGGNFGQYSKMQYKKIGDLIVTMEDRLKEIKAQKKAVKTDKAKALAEKQKNAKVAYIQEQAGKKIIHSDNKITVDDLEGTVFAKAKNKQKYVDIINQTPNPQKFVKNYNGNLGSLKKTIDDMIKETAEHKSNNSYKPESMGKYLDEMVSSGREWLRDKKTTLSRNKARKVQFGKAKGGAAAIANGVKNSGGELLRGAKGAAIKYGPKALKGAGEIAKGVAKGIVLDTMINAALTPTGPSYIEDPYKGIIIDEKVESPSVNYTDELLKLGVNAAKNFLKGKHPFAINPKEVLDKKKKNKPMNKDKAKKNFNI